MIAGLVPLAISAIGVAYAVLVLRAAHRRENHAFGALALVDAGMTAWRGLNVLAGDTIVDADVTVPCSIMTIVLAVLTIEFVTSFPRQAPMSWRWRGALVAWSVAGIGLILVERQTSALLRYTPLVYFAPATLLIFYLGWRSWRGTSESAARTVVAMLWFRWGFGFLAYMAAPKLGWFETAVWLETTVATLGSCIVIGTAVLRSQLFSIRSSAAEAITLAAMAFAAVLGGGGAIWAVQRYVAPGTLQQALLVGSTLVPLAIAALGQALYPRVERRVLAGLDDRRAQRLHLQGEPLPADARQAIAEACERIARMGEARVRWVPVKDLAPAVVAKLGPREPLRQDEDATAPAAMVVPAMSSELVGAFYIDDGRIDRDTYLVARDLGARVALAVERADAVSALEDARRLAALGQFAAAIAHDIRTPLTSISLNVQILRRKLQLPDDDREHLDIALEELARLDRSVAEILDFAKPVRLATEAIDVGELIETAARGLSPVLSEKGVALRTEPASLTVQGDPQRLRQVLVNLVDNAAEASRPGAEVTLRATRDRESAAHVAIEIEDRGRGIATDDLARIFEPFFTTRPDGTGLGLAICHKVIRAHGGDIRVRSIQGQGSTFTVLLPAA